MFISSHLRVLCLAIILQTVGCSSDTAKRTAYETLQNVHQQECLKNPSMDCEKRVGFEDYQRKRNELDSTE